MTRRYTIEPGSIKFRVDGYAKNSTGNKRYFYVYVKASSGVSAKKLALERAKLRAGLDNFHGVKLTLVKRTSFWPGGI